MSDAKQTNRLVWIRSILDRYEGPLTRYALRITGDLESARDVVQETFLRLCSENRAKVDGYLPQWLFTVCHNRAMDVRRKERRMQAASADGIRACESDDRDPAKIAERQEGAGRAVQLLALLPENQQEVIRLRFQNGLSYKEIAGVTKLSVSNVGYLIHTAIRTIREKLEECKGTEPSRRTSG
jgi:RNA polymerase sigma factor (sigma-70 family)